MQKLFLKSFKKAEGMPSIIIKKKQKTFHTIMENNQHSSAKIQNKQYS